MFSIEVHGADELVAKLDRYTKQIEDEGKEMLPHTVLEWQREDMKRRYPNQQTGTLGDGKETFVLVSIWPRSRTYVRKTRNAPRKAGRQLFGAPRAAGGHRPILRAELYEKLAERMKVMMEGALRWP